MKSEKLKSKLKNYANFDEEKKLWHKGLRVVVGLDEAGRGPLAGPVTAAAICVASEKFKVQSSPASPELSRGRAKFKITVQNSKLKEIRDSKKLTTRQRELWYEFLTKHPDIKWGIGAVSEQIIDKINIFEATKLAMKKAIQSLGIEPEFLLLDGNFSIRIARARPLASRNPNAPIRIIPCKSIIRGDEKVFSCAAASIIAKVTRDRLMCRYAKKYPQYGFDRHKGYGTKMHCDALKKHGPCYIHRKSFRPICEKKRSVIS